MPSVRQRVLILCLPPFGDSRSTSNLSVTFMFVLVAVIVMFAVTSVIVPGHHESHPHMTVDVVNNVVHVLAAPLAFPLSLLLLWLP